VKSYGCSFRLRFLAGAAGSDGSLADRDVSPQLAPGWLAHQQMEHLPGDEPLEAAQNVLVAEPFCLAAFGRGLGLLMPAQPHHSNAMQGGIGLPVAAPVLPVMSSVAGAGLQRAGTADASECGLRANRFRVVAGRCQAAQRLYRRRCQSSCTDWARLPGSTHRDHSSTPQAPRRETESAGPGCPVPAWPLPSDHSESQGGSWRRWRSARCD
jgi:hypothetical protein